jgi:hypothetical protein
MGYCRYNATTLLAVVLVLLTRFTLMGMTTPVTQ